MAIGERQRTVVLFFDPCRRDRFRRYNQGHGTRTAYTVIKGFRKQISRTGLILVQPDPETSAFYRRLELCSPRFVNAVVADKNIKLRSGWRRCVPHRQQSKAS